MKLSFENLGPRRTVTWFAEIVVARE